MPEMIESMNDIVSSSPPKPWPTPTEFWERRGVSGGGGGGGGGGWAATEGRPLRSGPVDSSARCRAARRLRPLMLKMAQLLELADGRGSGQDMVGERHLERPATARHLHEHAACARIEHHRAGAAGTRAASASSTGCAGALASATRRATALQSRSAARGVPFGRQPRVRLELACGRALVGILFEAEHEELV